MSPHQKSFILTRFPPLSKHLVFSEQLQLWMLLHRAVVVDIYYSREVLNVLWSDNLIHNNWKSLLRGMWECNNPRKGIQKLRWGFSVQISHELFQLTHIFSFTQIHPSWNPANRKQDNSSGQINRIKVLVQFFKTLSEKRFEKNNKEKTHVGSTLHTLRSVRLICQECVNNKLFIQFV